MLQATQRCYDANPYYEARYGVRGRAFAHADGGYLVTLTYALQSHVNEQVLWLATLLAARGMPSWLLEVHLRMLQEELASRYTSSTARFRKLGRAADRLQNLRCERLAKADFDLVVAEFNRTAGPGIDNAGCLLAGAVCDERGGSTRAVPTLTAWLGDPERFSQRWCSAVAEGIECARAMPVSTGRSRNARHNRP